MNKKEYEIIFIPDEGRAILNKQTNKIYCSEFEIIAEKNEEIDRLNNIIDELEKWLEEDYSTLYRDAGYRNNIINEVLDKLKELKEKNNEK